jgi:hypothetical protein
MKAKLMYPWIAGLALVVVAGCDQAQDRTRARETSRAETGTAHQSQAPAAEMVVYKSPTCGCCSAWVDHMRENGFEVEPVDLPVYAELSAQKAEQGVPPELESCHTAVVEGYVIEGHVPAEVVSRLLRERPDIKGLAVPGMPVGSPGMEGPNPQPYDVIAFDEDGSRTVFERVDPRD